jgi:hypothetical protein
MREPLEMVEPSAPDVHVDLGHVHDVGDLSLAAKDAFTQADGADAAVFAERQDNPALRVGKIDQQRIRA